MKRSQQLLQWRWRYVSLTGRRLMTYTTDKEEVVTNELEVTTELEVEVAEFYLAAPLKYGFMVMARDKTLRFAAESNELREEWIQAVANCAAGSAEAAAPDLPEPRPEPAAKKGPKGGPKGGPPPKGKGKGKGPKGPGKAPGPKGKTPLPLGGKGMPKASSLPLGRRLSVRLLLPGEATSVAMDHADAEGSDGSDVGRAQLAVDLEDLRQTFGASRSSSKQTPRAAAHEVGLELLPRKEAQNVAIVLKSLRRKWSDLQMEGLAASLDQLQPGDCPLPAEECERFIQVLPAPEHLLPLANYQEAASKLRDIERELLPLAKLTRLRERLRLLWLFKTLDKRMADAMRQMCTLQSACSQVRKSAVLRSLLEIIEVLFNYVNYGHTVANADQSLGTPAAGRRKVDVQSLTHLVETKSDPERAPFPKFNMLHFCIKDLLKQRPDFTFTQLEEELKDLSAASFVNLAHQSLALDRLKEDLEFVKTELHGHREEYQKKDESPKQAETPKAALVKFDLEENDTASEEEIHREGSDESVNRNLERSPKRSHLGQLVSSAIDTFSFAEDWWHGSAIIGINEKGGLDAVLAADGIPPPPGMIYRWRPWGRCKPYLCEVRGALLVLYRVKKIGHSASLRGTFYLVLPGAENGLLESLYASDFARQLARDKSCSGLELRPADGSRAEYFLTKTPKEAERWCDFLQTRTQQWDGGFVSHYVGWGFLSSCWRRLFCVLARPNRLLAFSRVRDYAEGLKPEHSWELNAASIVAFDAEKSSTIAKGLLSVAPVGFELLTADNQLLQFSVDSVQHLHCWLEELQSCVAPPPSRPSVSGVTSEHVTGAGQELFDLFAEPSPSGAGGSLSFSVVDGSGSPSQLRRKLMLSVGVVADKPTEQDDSRAVERADSDEEIQQGLLATSSFCALADAAGAVEEVVVPDALTQLRQLEVEMEGVVEKWTRTFAATEADCRALLRFFGLAKGALHSAAQELLQALTTFQQQLRVAWAEVEQHQSKTPRGPGPSVTRNRPSRTSAAAAASALPGPAVAADATESEATQSDSEERGTFLSVCSNES